MMVSVGVVLFFAYHRQRNIFHTIHGDCFDK
jgi:hypothetical protein